MTRRPDGQLLNSGSEQPINVSAATPPGAMPDFYQSILERAVSHRSTDIHMEPEGATARIRHRIDGVLHEVLRMPSSVYGRLLMTIKVKAGMDISQRRQPQDGGLHLKINGQAFDIRLSTLPVSGGEKLVMRLLPEDRRVMGLDELGMDTQDHQKLFSVLRKPHGLILVTGPTGAGKTTTLYASLRAVAAASLNITTIEDPIEYALPGVSQVEVKEKSGLTFSRGLRAILRQDPDILLVGEIRDQETARIVFQAALTGHLVLSTLHTADGCGTLHRLLEMGIEPYLITAALTAVVSQRLVRKSCESCSAARPPLEWELALARSVDVSLNEVLEPAGCDACDSTGFFGRTGIYELLVMDQDSRCWINQRGSRKDFEAWATPAHFRSLLCRAVEQAARGSTTPAEVVRVLGAAHTGAPHPE